MSIKPAHEEFSLIMSIKPAHEEGYSITSPRSTLSVDMSKCEESDVESETNYQMYCGYCHYYIFENVMSIMEHINA